jgi:hypothetical protein
LSDVFDVGETIAGQSDFAKEPYCESMDRFANDMELAAAADQRANPAIE